MASYPSITTAAPLANATDLVVKAWDKVLQDVALPEDPFFSFGGNYISDLKTVPDGIYMRIPRDPNAKGAHSITFPLLMPLSSDPEYGTGTDPLSNAEQQSVKQFTGYFNDWDKSVKFPGYGIDYIDGENYQLFSKVTPQLQLWIKEEMGYWVRYAMLNGYSPNLLSSPVSLSVVPHPNTLIKGDTLAQQPSERYTTNPALMASIIASEFSNIPATTNGALDFDFIDRAITYFTYEKPLMPLTVGGESLFVLTVPTSQTSHLLNPASTDGLGTIWQAVARFNDLKKANFPLSLGQFKNVILMEDPRAPAAKAYGTGSGSSTASATNAVYVDSFLKPGLNDQRTALGSTDVMEACFFLGKGAFADIEQEPAHYEDESQYLGKVVIKGAMGSRGFSRMDYDFSSKTVTSIKNQSSGVMWVRKQVASF
jgi:hypothetical protein